MLVMTGFVVVLVLANVSGFRPVLARGWHGQTSSLSGKFCKRSCFRIFTVSCRMWSAFVRWHPSPSAAIVTQLVTRLRAHGSGGRKRSALLAAMALS
jgi:hypothetical protein